MRAKLAPVVWLVAVLVALCGVLLAPKPAVADDTSLGATGGTISAVSAGDIRLDAETVQAVCFGSFAEYRVDFRFVNDGPARTVRLGFPFSSTDAGDHGAERPIGFQAWQGGRQLSVRAVAVGQLYSSHARGYFVHSAHFAHGATMITVSYLSQESGTATVRQDGAPPALNGMASWYEYWLHTGATWKGPIGTAVVRYRLAGTFHGGGLGLTATRARKGVPVTTPGWTRPLADTWQWRLSDFEPASAKGGEWWRPQLGSDIVVGFSSMVWGHSKAVKWTASDSAATLAAGGGPGSLQDGLLTSAWMAGPLADGDHPWAEATFRRPRRLRELRIVSGDNAYIAAFKRYGRPKTVTAAFSDGSTVILHLKDAPVLQRFPVDVTTGSVRLTVDDLYPGADYPSVAISEVEFDSAQAPGYARFADLLRDDRAVGRLPAWAGRIGPGLVLASRPVEWAARQDAEAVSGGELIGVDQYAAFPTDHAPFRQPASLDDIVAPGDDRVVLPGAELVGKPTAVDSLSTWTFDVRYDSGVELLVDTKVVKDASSSVLAELLAESKDLMAYADGRRLPYEVTTIGRRVVGVARAGTIPADSSEDGDSHVPAQVFWRDGTVTYHLYARTGAVSAAHLVTVARGMLEPVAGTAAAPASAADQSKSGHPWWWAAILVAVLLVLAVGLYVRRPGRTAVHADESAR